MPDTDDAVPVVQRLVVGRVVKDWELEEPQEPEIGTTLEAHDVPFHVVPDVHDAVADCVASTVAPLVRVKVLDPCVRDLVNDDPVGDRENDVPF